MKYQTPFSWKNKKNISKLHLQEVLINACKTLITAGLRLSKTVPEHIFFIIFQENKIWHFM